MKEASDRILEAMICKNPDGVVISRILSLLGAGVSWGMQVE
ncbi:MAG TPA: hypothetical protein PK659_04020 [Methanothrix sp.]|nr:hypothetical protein [Methanothrix sp.]HOK58003.1 hypothetical protein [Methanothrix sp.]HOL43406.1 hypothetical protein [Methanothrix sp.]HPO88409.1 hypothetical protein [Methanothrix sp.]